MNKTVARAIVSLTEFYCYITKCALFDCCARPCEKCILYFSDKTMCYVNILSRHFKGLLDRDIPGGMYVCV